MNTLPLIQKPPYQYLVSPRGVAVLIQHAFANVTVAICVARHGNQGQLSLKFHWYCGTLPTSAVERDPVPLLMTLEFLVEDLRLQIISVLTITYRFGWYLFANAFQMHCLISFPTC